MPMNKKGIISTLVFHGILLILFLIFGFSTPLPLPGEDGILINFGNSKSGYGSIEPAISEPRQQEKIQQAPPPRETSIAETKENLLTQDFEEAPAISSKKETKKKKEEPVKKTIEKPNVEKKPKEEPKKVDTRKLYSEKNIASETSGSEGETQPGGNQGSNEGSSESNNRLGGTGEGNGPSFELTGRGQVFLPVPSLNYQKQGVVKVEILVDRSGKVVSAREGVRGTTTTDITLLRLAKEAALKSTFTSKDDAPAHQKGYITYYFELK